MQQPKRRKGAGYTRLPISLQEDQYHDKKRAESILAVSIEDIRRRLAALPVLGYDTVEGSKRMNFKAAISPESNQEAEDELRREVHKDTFGQMDVIGQVCVCVCVRVRVCVCVCVCVHDVYVSSVYLQLPLCITIPTPKFCFSVVQLGFHYYQVEE